MNKLHQKICQPCNGKVDSLSESEIDKLIHQVDGWNLDVKNKLIYKEFKFKNFKQTLEFVNKVGEIAEKENHHPDINFTWGYCKISIQTHKINNLHQNDFILAAKIDKLTSFS